MNVQAFQHLYDYHFTANRRLWTDGILPLPQAQFIQPIAYSLGSVRDQLVHMVSVDDTWFSGLRGLDIPAPLDPTQFEDRAHLRAHWDAVEGQMRGFLATLSEAQLASRPFPPGEDEGLRVWQVLLQVVNHGTDHRAQVLRLLHDFGIRTTSQDYIFHVYDNPI